MHFTTAWPSLYAAGSQKRLRPATIAQKRILIELALHAVVEAGTDPASITTLDYLFEPHVFQIILERVLRKRRGGDAETHGAKSGGMLITLAKQRLGSEPAALARIAELRRLQKCLGPPPAGLTAKNQQLLRELADPSDSRTVAVIAWALATGLHARPRFGAPKLWCLPWRSQSC